MVKQRVKKKRDRSKAAQPINDLQVPSERERREMERAQVWSVDVLLAVVIFIAIILVFYTTLGSKSKTSLKDVQSEASKLKDNLERNINLGFLKEDKVDSSKFDNFTIGVAENYTLVKDQLGIVGDFCIYLVDDRGNLILINNPSFDNLTSIGNSTDVLINNRPCGARYS